MIGQVGLVHWNKKKFQGIIMDDTKNTILIKTEQGIKRIMKKGATILINDFKIQGKDIIKSLEDRIKK